MDETVVISFTATAAGSVTVQVLPTPDWGGYRRTNLLMGFNLTDAAETPLVNSMVGYGIGPLTVALPAAGTYFVWINGTGAGDPVYTGYSSYGSRGQFEVVVTYPTGPATLTPPASPSPSPSSSLSPSPTPSPSPTGGVPQPSPPPSPEPLPSPSPSPAPPQYLTVAAVVGDQSTKNSRSYYCSFALTVTNSGMPVDGATVTATLDAAGSQQQLTATTLSTGVATLVQTGRGVSAGTICTLTVKAVSAGLALDPAAPPASGTYTVQG
jgi:hypothetical protein